MKPLKRTKSIELNEKEPDSQHNKNNKTNQIDTDNKIVRPNQLGSDSNASNKISLTLVRQIMNNSKKQQATQLNMRDIVRASLRFFVCQICFNNFEIKDTEVVGECGHRFCTDCLVQYAIYKIKINQDISCPNEGCKEKITQDSSLFSKLPNQMKDKFKEHEIWRQNANNPNAKLCPNEHCKAGIVDLLKNPPECQKCQTKFCKQCMMVFHEGPCDQNFQVHFKQWKKCPNCKIFIEKIQGCNHMVCRCKHQFCFVCLSNWQSSHYTCQGINGNRMFFNEQESVPKCQAIAYLILLCILFPFFLLLAAVLLVLGLCLSIVVGVLASPIAACQAVNGCCCSFILFFIILPFVAVVAIIAAPIFFLTTFYIPMASRKTVQYCRSLQFLFDQARGIQRPRN